MYHHIRLQVLLRIKQKEKCAAHHSLPLHLLKIVVASSESSTHVGFRGRLWQPASVSTFRVPCSPQQRTGNLRDSWADAPARPRIQLVYKPVSIFPHNASVARISRAAGAVCVPGLLVLILSWSFCSCLCGCAWDLQTCLFTVFTLSA